MQGHVFAFLIPKIPIDYNIQHSISRFIVKSSYKILFLANFVLTF
jgi:hypothetical protein